MKKNFTLPKATLERIAAEAREDRQIVEECKTEIATALDAGVPVVRIHEGLAMAGFRGSRGVLADMLEKAGLRQKQLRGDDRLAMLREALAKAETSELAEPAPLPIKAEITPPVATPEPPALPEAPATPAPRTRRTRAGLLAEARTRAKTAIIETATKTAKTTFTDRKAELDAQGKTLENAEAQAIAQAIAAALEKDAETRASRPRPRHAQKGTVRARAEKKEARQAAIKAEAKEAARRTAEETARREAELAAQAKREMETEARARAMLDRLAAMEDAIKTLATQIETQAKATTRAEEQARATAKAMIAALTDITRAQTTLAAQTQKEADSQTARLAALEARLFPPAPPAPTPTPRPLKSGYANPKLKAQPHRKKWK